MINLAILSDIRLYCDGIRELLERTDTISVAGIAQNSDETSTLLENVHIDVILINMQITTCNEILALFTRKHLDAKIIVLDDFTAGNYNLTHCNANINGFLSSNSTIEELIEAIETVIYKDSVYCSDNIAEIGLAIRGSQREKADDTRLSNTEAFDDLTRRETQIINLLVQGLSNKQISKILAIEISTVKNHVHNILVKLGVESRARVACMFRNNTPTPALNLN
ncbi:MAG TPA: response regulator transcription factor [Gammaproteobacteria bacterium]|nr:response regulator transcription factor [Gammaproteobacteria bacterium]